MSHTRTTVIEMSDETDRGVVERAMIKVNKLWMDTQEARQRSFTEQMGMMLKAGRTQNIWVGFVLNLATLVIGIIGYLTLSGWAQFGIAVFGLLGLLGIIGWVLHL